MVIFSVWIDTIINMNRLHSLSLNVIPVGSNVQARAFSETELTIVARLGT